MGKWWMFQSKAKKASQEMLFAREEIVRNQPNSKLQSFINYANRTQTKYQLSVTVDIEEAGDLVISFQFDQEKGYRFRVPKVVQKSPEKLIDALYEHDYLNGINDDLMRDKEDFLRLERAEAKMENFIDENIDYSLDEKRRIAITVKKLLDRHTELNESLMNTWYNSPYLAERIHYVYRAFLLEEVSRPSDPVEADLAALLEDEALSVETKSKARDLLSQYKEQQREKELDSKGVREKEALIILSTVEEHYIEKRGSVDYGKFT